MYIYPSSSFFQRFLSGVIALALGSAQLSLGVAGKTVHHQLEGGITYIKGTFEYKKERNASYTVPNQPQKPPQQSAGIYNEEHLEEMLQESLLMEAKDGRKRITETTQWPNLFHSQLTMHFPSGKYGGSGILVGPQHLLTAGHNAGATRGTQVQANALLVLRYNLFDGGSRAFEKKGAVETITEAEKKVSSLKLDLEKETQATWADIQTLLRQEKIFKQATYYKKQVALSYVKQFDIGARSLLDILNSINDFFLTSALHVNTTVNYQISCIKLMALGSHLLKGLGVQNYQKG